MAIRKTSENKNVVISTKTIFTTASLALLIWLLIQIKTIVLILFISLMLAVGVNPLVAKLEKRKFPRGAAVLLIFLIIISLLILIGFAALPPLIHQITIFINSLPQILESLSNVPLLGRVAVDLNNFLAEKFVGASGNVVKATLGAFSTVFSIFSVLVFTAYILLDLDNLRDAFLYFLPEKPRKEARITLKEIEERVGGWLRGELILMVVVGTFTYIGLLILNVKYATALALIAGVLEIVPIIGPIISIIPATIVGFSQSPVTAVGVFGLYVLVQQLENNIIVPKVMQKVVGFNPLVTLLALLIGGKLFGVVGALVSIPVTLVVVITTRHVLEY